MPAHLDLDGYRGLALLADRDLLVIALDGCAAREAIWLAWGYSSIEGREKRERDGEGVVVLP